MMMLLVFLLFFVLLGQSLLKQRRNARSEILCASSKRTALELRPVAVDFLNLLQNTPSVRDIPGIHTTTCAIIGGLAVISHAPHRVTQDIDFCLSNSEIGPHIKATLVRHRPDKCRFFAGIFKFLADDGWVQVDLVPEIKLPLVPTVAEPIMDVRPSALPVASAEELIVLKAASCGSRGVHAQAVKDALDCLELAQSFNGTG
ncbi:hypothetical protein BJY00DRAFT_119350 [Aspergillus carlsbadensis]|nr:hypothetical protein BJY00DRAFT_119350 [Aspergillus carlsbadensis]